MLKNFSVKTVSKNCVKNISVKEFKKICVTKLVLKTQKICFKKF